MNLFSKNVIPHLDSKSCDALMLIFNAIGDRFRGLDAEVETLRKEIAALKSEPRTSLKQRIREKS